MGCAFSNTSDNDPNKGHRRSYKKTKKIDCRKKSTQLIDLITENIQII